MKRGFNIKKSIFAALCMGVILTGCSGKGEYGLDPKDPEEIMVWHYYNGAQAIAFEDLVSEFNDTVGMEKGIVVHVESKSSIDELTNALKAAADKKAGAEEMPNIFQSYLDTAVETDEKGLLTDLNRYVTEEEKSEFVDGYVQEGYFGKEGEWKLFPIAKSTEVLALNKTDWDQFAAATGADRNQLATWEGLNAVAQQYYEYTGGKSFFGRDAFANYMIIGSRQLGTEIFSVDEGKVTLQLDREVMKKLWDNFYVPYVKGYYTQVGRYRTDDVKIGEIIAFAGSTSGIVYFPNEVTEEDQEPYAIEHMILPIPNFEGTEAYAVQQGASMAVGKSTERKEYASVLFLKWFTQADRNMSFSVRAGYMPVKKEANDVDAVKKYIEEHAVDIKEVEKDSLITGIEQVNNSNMFTSKGFTGGYQARAVLEDSMKNLAIQNRSLAQQQIAAGKTQEEAEAAFLQESCFEDWFQSLEKQLEEACR